jgi:hypothetical protein
MMISGKGISVNSDFRMPIDEISGNEYFRDSYLEKRLELGAGLPLNIFYLRKSLLVLQPYPRMRAEL